MYAQAMFEDASFKVKGCEVVQGMATSTLERFDDCSVCVSIKLENTVFSIL